MADYNSTQSTTTPSFYTGNSVYTLNTQAGIADYLEAITERTEHAYSLAMAATGEDFHGISLEIKNDYFEGLARLLRESIGLQQQLMTALSTKPASYRTEDNIREISVVYG